MQHQAATLAPRMQVSEIETRTRLSDGFGKGYEEEDMKTGNQANVSRRAFVRAGSAAVASAALFGVAGCSPQLSDTDETPNAVPGALFTAGTYTATGNGRKGDITVELTCSDTAIESVAITDHGETERIAAPAFEKIPADIVEFQSLGVDTVTGATLSSMGVLTAVEECVRQAGGDVSALKSAPTRELSTDTVELDCDLAVVGAGISGMAAALAAAQHGAKVVVFEKSSSMGGNALVSGGFLEYVNAPAELRAETNDGYNQIFQEILDFNREDGTDPAAIEAVQKQWDDYYAEGNTKLFCSTEFQAMQLHMLEGNTFDYFDAYTKDVAGGVAWLDEMNYPWMPLCAIPGYNWPYFSNSTEDVNGEGYFNLFEREMEGLDLQILFATPAEELIVENGKVTGAKGTCTDGTSYTVHAKDGVIIASGGYAENQEMLKEHDKMWNWDQLSTFHCDNNYGHTGDGIRMAMDAGAAFEELPFNQMIFPFVDTVLFMTETTVGTTNESLYVNKEGKRFCDESGSRTDMTVALMNQTDGVGFQVVDHDSSMITDGHTHTNMDVEYAIEKGILYRADTLEELADLMGVDKATFMQTVKDYNTMASTYEDPEFGRASFGPNALLDTPPFYASPRTWAMHITLDGLAVDNEHRALDAAGKPIEGLYAVGEAACGGRGVSSLGSGYALAARIYGA